MATADDSASNATAQTQIEALYRQHGRRVRATLIRLLGDFDLAEEVLHDAFRAALEQWPSDGVPQQPRAWLVSTGRFKAIDRLRRQARFDTRTTALAATLTDPTADPATRDDEGIDDDELRLIFTCCHPALAQPSQVALTLREVCGLTTEEIARAFLRPAATVAQRIVRAKAKIRDAGIPYEVPPQKELSARLAAVLAVIYLVFNEGYSASSGASVTRPALSATAIRLGRVLVDLLPQSEAIGLLALMLLQESRRRARSSADGELVLLPDQDRTLWDKALIEQGAALTERALRLGHAASMAPGPYALQAAIAALHAQASDAASTDWAQIIGLYDVLLTVNPSAIVELNRAVAVAMRDGAEAGLALVDGILQRGELADYHLAYAVRADLCRRLGRRDEARAAYRRALELAQQAPERRFLERRLAALFGEN